MIICLRQIILRKAIYRITIPLLYPRSQTSSLECVFVWLCTQYTPYFFPLANIHASTHAPLPFCQTFRIAICFQECICIIVWYHWTPVSLHSFFQSTNTVYPLSNLHGTKTASASLQKASHERSLFKCSFVFYLFITVSAPHPGDQIKYSKGPKGSLILYKATSTLLFQKQIAFIVDLQQCPAWRHEDMRTTWVLTRLLHSKEGKLVIKRIFTVVANST